jgi:hypothetical protein
VLADRGLWDRAGTYNRGVAQSTEDTLLTGERTRRGAVTFQNSIRADLAVKWAKRGEDKESLVRVINRMFTEESWKKGSTLRRIELVLVQNLGLIGKTSTDMPLNEPAVSHKRGDFSSVVIEEDLRDSIRLGLALSGSFMSTAIPS